MRAVQVGKLAVNANIGVLEPPITHPHPFERLVSSWRLISAETTPPRILANARSCSSVVDQERFPAYTMQDFTVDEV